MSLPTCDTAGCPGHLGKFSDCVTEALWELGLDGGDDSTGDTDWHGHFTLHVLPVDESVTIDPDGQARTVLIPQGSYIVQCYPSGMVDFASYPTEAIARQTFASIESEYADWVGDAW